MDNKDKLIKIVAEKHDLPKFAIKEIIESPFKMLEDETIRHAALYRASVQGEWIEVPRSVYIHKVGWFIHASMEGKLKREKVERIKAKIAARKQQKGGNEFDPGSITEF